MKPLAQLGTADPGITYTNRHTVKVVITKDNSMLIMNGGLLPGGGVEPGETNEAAARRELLEELGATVTDLRSVGTVTQHRNFLQKKYIVHGYRAKFESLDETATARQADEHNITYEWVPIGEAKQYIANTIAEYTTAHPTQEDDLVQGRIYNMQTTLAIVRAPLESE